MIYMYVSWHVLFCYNSTVKFISSPICYITYVLSDVAVPPKYVKS